MAYISNYQYYTNGGVTPTDENWGEYQYVSLHDIVNDFMLMNVGPDKLVDNVKRYEVLYYAKDAVKELNFDAMRNIKVIEINVGDNLKMILPPDYVDYIRISLNVDGQLYPLTENSRVLSANAYLQDNNNEVLFDLSGEVLTGTSVLDIKRLEQQTYWGPGIYNGCQGWCWGDNWYFSYRIGSRYGMDPSEANINPKFRVNRSAGVIDFSSMRTNSLIVIEYVSDGMENGDDDLIQINKFAERFVKAHIKYMLMTNKASVNEYIVRRTQTERKAELRNARIRMSNIHPSRLLMTLRGQGKWIK